MQLKTKLRSLRGQRLGAFALALVMVFSVLISAGPDAFAVTQKEINALKSQASSLNSQKSDLQSQLNKLSKSKNAAIDEKFLIEEKIDVIQQQITLSEEAIAKYGELIAQKEVELAEAKEEEAKYYDEFCDRVRSMEERGTISYWAVLFNASSFSDLLDRVNAISEVVDYDNMIMDQLAAARQAVADAKQELEDSKAAEEKAKAELDSQKADLQTEKANVEAVINEITSQADVYEEKLHDLEDDSANLSSQIKQAEKAYADQLAAQKAAEEAAAKKKAEEEAKKKAQQAAANNAANNSSSSSSSNNAGTSSGSTSSGTSAGSGGYLWPLSGYRNVTSAFGWRNCPFHGREFHSGVDIPAPSGTPIMATKGGVVIISAYGSSYGNYVVVAHSDGGRSLYAHMSSRSVSAGQSVSQGQKLGAVGTTGSSTGNHLHFELWMGNSQSSRVNPVAYCS